MLDAKKKVTSIFCIVMMLGALFSQDCDCDIILSGLSETNFNIISSTNFNNELGKTICLPGGEYAGIEFRGFNGTIDEPLIIKNCDGQVIIDEKNKSAITFRESSFIILSGKGDLTFNYGIKIESAAALGTAGVNITNYSTDIEIEFLEISNTGFAGILGKTDPNCNDIESWRKNGFVMRNIDIHDNYIHDTKGEAIYLGSTGGYLVSSNLVCNNQFVFAHWLENINVHDNIIENIGWDGIQLNLVRKYGRVYNNIISGYGTEDVTFQTFAMSLGGGEYEVYNNRMFNYSGGSGQGVQLISAKSGTKFYNNVIINPQLHGIFIHNRHEFDSHSIGYYILNNTIVNPELSGVFYNTIITESEDESIISSSQENVPTFFINNLIIDPGNRYEESNTWKGEEENYFDFNKLRTRNVLHDRIVNNWTTRNIDELCLASPDEYDFRLASDVSPLVDAGRDLRPLGLQLDLNENLRYVGNGMDIGAFEFQGAILNFKCYSLNADVFNLLPFDADVTVVFPNPASDSVQFFNTKHQETNLKLFTSHGALLLESNYKFGDRLDISNLSKGLYYATFDISNPQEVVKVLIE